jgi:hypothetical protein
VDNSSQVGSDLLQDHQEIRQVLLQIVVSRC